MDELDASGSKAPGEIKKQTARGYSLGGERPGKCSRGLGPVFVQQWFNH